MRPNGRCHLEPLALARIVDNPLLSAALTDRDVQHCFRGIKQYGLLSPLVLHRSDGEHYTVLAGACELQALRKMKIKQTDAVVVAGINDNQAHQLSLHLLSLRSTKDSLTEAFLVQKLLKDPHLSQADVALMVGRSVSWVSKRALLVERLDPTVQALVMDKVLPARTAQEIAKLPLKFQHSFAVKVISESMPKSAVEHLVAAYNRGDTTAAVKRHILESPKQALPYCAAKKAGSKPEQSLGSSRLAKEKQLYSYIRLLFKVTNDLEALWAEMTIPEHVRDSFGKALERLCRLQKLESILAPGQALNESYVDPQGFAPGQKKGDRYAN
ncbi:MAG TPA: hypothetical protein GX528_02535 [Firmicutes bacterium]|nr:hypothetical protein [Bacillota bacterium]